MVQNIITDLCHHLEIGIDGNLDIGNKRVIVGTPTITLTNNILTVTCDTVGANIYYTLDGSTPTSSSTKYTSAVTLNNSCTIKAIAIKGNKSSIVVSQDYIAILSAWKIVGNSEVHGNEIWSCGEYNPIDGKYHILVQPQGDSVADIALTEPLRKVNDVADTIEFPSNTEGKALVTRPFKSVDMSTIEWYMYNSSKTQSDGIYCIYGLLADGKQLSTNDNAVVQNILTPRYRTTNFNTAYIISSDNNKIISYGCYSSYRNAIRIQDSDYNQSDSATAFKTAVRGVELIYELETPTTELVDAPQIEEADSYSMVISQGGKAVSWSGFISNPS